MKTRKILAALACAALAALPLAAQAGAYPDRPIRIVVPFPPGGTSDSVARLLAKGLSDKLRQPVIVDNKGGAGTIIGTEFVANSAPDGYTLLWMTTPFAINASLYKKLRYDTLKDFTAVTDVVQVPLVLIVRSDSPYRSVDDVVAAARKEPGKLSYSSSGIGGSPHLATVMFSSMQGIQLNHVPYQGSAPSVMSTLAGQTDLVFDTLFLTYPQVKAGKARALAQTGAARTPLLPDVPTMAEAGLKGYEATSWLSLAAPSGTPADIMQRLNQAANEVMKTPEFADPLVKQGVVIVGNTPAQAAANLRREVQKWGDVVRESGATAQ